MKVGLFFGSFNPIHIGHLIIANMVLEQTAIKEVWFVVSPQNPFKSSKFLAHEFDRLKMVELAIHDHWGFRASDVEFHMPRPSYTAHTLAWLSDKHPNHEFKVIMGEDNLQNFPKWKNYKAILDNYGIIVYPRPGASTAQEPLTHPNIQIIQAPLLDISATFLRQCFRKNISTKFLLPDSVSDYIKAKAIYP
jgi:nicotinate-nucleotide adenylyltransferase